MARDMPKLAVGKSDPARDADRQIGARIRQRRVALGLTQQQVATMVGVTYQQAQKYESGRTVSPRAGCSILRRCLT